MIYVKKCGCRFDKDERMLEMCSEHERDYEGRCENIAEDMEFEIWIRQYTDHTEEETES